MSECKNSMTGKHKLVDQHSKNKGKNICVFCRQPMPPPGPLWAGLELPRYQPQGIDR